MTTFGRRLRGVAVPLTATRALGQGAELVGWILLARRLGTSAFGQVSIAFLVARYLGLIADYGASFRGPRDVAAGWHRSVHFLARRRVLLACVLGAAFVVATTLRGDPFLIPIAAVVLAIGMSRDWLALGREQGMRAGAPAPAQGLLLLAGAIFVTTASGAAVVIGLAYGAAGLLSVALNRLPPPDDDSELRSDSWTLLAVLANQLSSTADILLVGWLLSVSSAGIYAAIYRIPNGYLALVGMLFAGFLPLVTKLQSESPSEYRRIRRRSLRVSTSCAAVLALSAVPTGLLVPVLFGEEYRAGRWPLTILIFSTAVLLSASPFHAFAQASGRDRDYALVLTVGAGLNLVLNLSLIPVFGLNGAATATLLTQVIVAMSLWLMLRNSWPVLHQNDASRTD